MAQQVDDLGKQGVDVALGATLGAMHAAQDAGLEAERLTEAAMRGTFDALSRTSAVPLDILRGAIYGVIRGASETDLHISAVAVEAIEAARNAASMLGLSKQEAARYAAQVVVEAAKDLGGRDETEIKEAVLGDLIDPPEQGQESESE